MLQNENNQILDAEQEWLNYWNHGPTRLRWTKLPLQVGDVVPRITLKDASGVATDLWDKSSDKPTLVIFLRHFGCSCAMDRAERLKSEYPEYAKHGARVITVGQGEPERSKSFAIRNSLPCPILCDPTRMAYEAFDLLEGEPSQVVYGLPDDFLKRDPTTGLNFQKSRTGTPRSVVDSPWQLPGEFIIDKNGIIRLAYRSQYCADFPDPQVLVAAITTAKWAQKASIPG